MRSPDKAPRTKWENDEWDSIARHFIASKKGSELERFKRAMETAVKRDRMRKITSMKQVQKKLDRALTRIGAQSTLLPPPAPEPRAKTDPIPRPPRRRRHGALRTLLAFIGLRAPRAA